MSQQCLEKRVKPGAMCTAADTVLTGILIVLAEPTNYFRRPQRQSKGAFDVIALGANFALCLVILSYCPRTAAVAPRQVIELPCHSRACNDHFHTSRRCRKIHIYHSSFIHPPSRRCQNPTGLWLPGLDARILPVQQREHADRRRR